MATLWNKGVAATEPVDRFTVGNDRVLDQRLAAYDIEGSKAHIRMLESIGLLSTEELKALLTGLDAIAATVREAKKCIETGEEKVILFNLSGHGLIDMPSYEAYIKGDLQNYTVTDEMIAENLAELDKQ